MKFAAALLLGLVSAVQDDTTKVWELRSVRDHKTESREQKEYGDHSISSANARPPYQSSFVQAESSSDSSDSSSSESDEEDVQLHGSDPNGYGPHLDEGPGGYVRKVPARFAEDTDDIFMRSMIKTYAIEGKTCDDDDKNCKPNGSFWMNPATARAAANEVLRTHKNLRGEARKQYLNTYFQKAWRHFDVNQTGWIEVIKMPMFMRFLASDQYMSLGESG